MRVYLDTSVVLRRLLDVPGALRDWSSWEVAVSSELMQIEAMRTLDRFRVTGRLSGAQLADCIEQLGLMVSGLEEVPVQRSVLRRAAASFPTAVGTLDAIHLATAMLWTEHNAQPLAFVTHDRQLRVAARACGLPVHPAS